MLFITHLHSNKSAAAAAFHFNWRNFIDIFVLDQDTYEVADQNTAGSPMIWESDNGGRDKRVFSIEFQRQCITRQFEFVVCLVKWAVGFINHFGKAISVELILFHQSEIIYKNSWQMG